MRNPLKAKTGHRGQVSVLKSYPAPVGGWNARDSLADMKPVDAIVLDNLFPKTSYVESRGGSASHATAMTGNGKTLAVYNALSGTNKMFCTTASGTYDVSSAGAVGASVSARTNGKHQWVNFGDGTNNYLIMVNGVDKPLYYNGTTWVAVDAASSPALTGLTTTEIIHVFVFKGRLIFIQKASMSFWYLASGAAGGALTKFDLSSVAKKGGYLMAADSWTVDGGNGFDDRAVFVTSEGEVIIYQGTNPSSAADWALIGVYNLGKPLGRRCVHKYGGDLLIITQNGAFPMAATLMTASSDYNKFALSFKIENAFNDASRSYGSVFGWTVTSYNAQSALIVNIPLAEDGIHYQYVMNTITKAWCRFKAWDAEDFAVFNGELYYTDGTVVIKAWTGKKDLGLNIEYYGKTAFSYFGSMEQKKFSMFRPVMAADASVSFLTDIDVDFKDKAVVGNASVATVIGATWDTSLWDSAYWVGGFEVVKNWTSPSEYTGYCASGKLKISSNSITVQWMSNDYVFEKGGIL